MAKMMLKILIFFIIIMTDGRKTRENPLMERVENYLGNAEEKQ